MTNRIAKKRPAPYALTGMRIAKWSGIAVMVGILSGTASAAFLKTLEWALVVREGHPGLIWFLPLGGFLVGLVYHHFGRTVERGNNLLLEEVHDPRAVIPLRMVPLIFLGTVWTHLFGGSAGREGTAVQMGGSLADQMSRPLKLPPSDRRALLMAGMSAGFGSVFGVPWAGALFGLEVLAVGRLRVFALLECVIASFVGHFTTLAWGVHHTAYAPPSIPSVTAINLGVIAVAGVAFGLCARVFSKSIHHVGAAFKRIRYSPLRPILGGLLVSCGFYALGTLRYAGLGVPVIEASLKEPLSAADFALKLIFTVLTLGSGFKGGEVTPLLFIGATLGNALAQILPMDFSVLAAVGFVAVFAGAANTPLACTVMAAEIFGPSVGLFALIGCGVSFLCSGDAGIYGSQRVLVTKRAYLRSPRSWIHSYFNRSE